MTHTENWTPLSDIGHVDRGNPKPRSIRFPDGWSKSFSTAPRYGGGLDKHTKSNHRMACKDRKIDRGKCSDTTSRPARFLDRVWQHREVPAVGQPNQEARTYRFRGVH